MQLSARGPIWSRKRNRTSFNWKEKPAIIFRSAVIMWDDENTKYSPETPVLSSRNFWYRSCPTAAPRGGQRWRMANRDCGNWKTTSPCQASSQSQSAKNSIIHCLQSPFCRTVVRHVCHQLHEHAQFKGRTTHGSIDFGGQSYAQLTLLQCSICVVTLGQAASEEETDCGTRAGSKRDSGQRWERKAAFARASFTCVCRPLLLNRTVPFFCACSVHAGLTTSSRNGWASSPLNVLDRGMETDS